METALPDNIIMHTCRFVHDLILYVHMYVRTYVHMYIQYMNMNMDMYIHAQYMRLFMSCFFFALPDTDSSRTQGSGLCEPNDLTTAQE